MRKINHKLSHITDRRARATAQAAEGSIVIAGERDDDGSFPVSISFSGIPHYLVSNRNDDLYGLLASKSVTLGELRRSKARRGRRAKGLEHAISRVVEVADYVLDEFILSADGLGASVSL